MFYNNNRIFKIVYRLEYYKRTFKVFFLIGFDLVVIDFTLIDLLYLDFDLEFLDLDFLAPIILFNFGGL